MSFVYIIRNLAGKLYIGITRDLNDRLNYHNNKMGAQFTKSRYAFYLVLSEEYATLAQARRREIQLKKWRRSKKEVLIERFRQGLPTKFI